MARKRIACFLAGVALATLVLARYSTLFEFAEAASPGTLLFEQNFEAAESKNFLVSGSGVFASGCAGADEGGTGGRLTIEWSAERPACRAEIVPTGVRSFFHECYPRIGHEYEYSFRLYLPADWQADSTAESVAQWHGARDTLLFEGDLNPPLALNIVGDHYRLDQRHDARLVVPSATHSRYQGENQRDLGAITADLGKWTSWVFCIRWAHDASGQGFVRVWKNGDLVSDHAGPNCFRDLRGGPYWKIGPYKWTWEQSEDVPPAVTKRVLGIDSVRIVVPPFRERR